MTKKNAGNNDKARNKDLINILPEPAYSRQLKLIGLSNSRARLIERKHKLIKSKSYAHDIDSLLIDQYQIARDDYNDLKDFPNQYYLSKQERCGLHTRTKRQVNSIGKECFEINAGMTLRLLGQVIRNCNLIFKYLRQSQAITIQDFRRFIRTCQLEINNFRNKPGGNHE